MSRLLPLNLKSSGSALTWKKVKSWKMLLRKPVLPPDQQINHPQRLTYPLMRRSGKNSPLERCTWDEALDAIVSKFREQAIAAHVELQKGERSELAEVAANLL